MKKIIVVKSKAVFSSLFIGNWQRNFGVRPECPLRNFLYNLAELIRGHLVGEKRVFLKKCVFRPLDGLKSTRPNYTKSFFIAFHLLGGLSYPLRAFLSALRAFENEQKMTFFSNAFFGH